MKRDKKIRFAKKSFGQNFLVDQNYINKIISAINPQNDEQIIEIGSGRGALTEILVDLGVNVFAIEFEREMINVLKEKFVGKENFKLIAEDALKVNYSQISEQNNEFKLVANLPYNISTAILQKLIEHRQIFSEMVLMFQKEVVERIIAEENSSERGFLSVWAQTFLETEKLFDVPPTAFRPIPKVWSSVVRLIPKKTSIGNETLFREIISAGFAQRRKTILNNLKVKIADADSILNKCGIDPKRRAETLTLEEWMKIYLTKSEFDLSLD